MASAKARRRAERARLAAERARLADQTKFQGRFQKAIIQAERERLEEAGQNYIEGVLDVHEALDQSSLHKQLEAINNQPRGMPCGPTTKL